MEDTMCISRQDVQDIVDRSTRELHEDLNAMKSDREAIMQRIARDEVRKEKDSVVKFFGFGGLVAALTLVWYGGGITNDVDHLQGQVEIMSAQITKLDTTLVNTTTKTFTSEDSEELRKEIRTYVDQQDEFILRRVEDRLATLSQQLELLIQR